MNSLLISSVRLQHRETDAYANQNALGTATGFAHQMVRTRSTRSCLEWFRRDASFFRFIRLVRSRTFWKNSWIDDSLSKLFFPADNARGIELYK
jgi:predicted patatin/cPLA2 family phospholipase